MNLLDRKKFEVAILLDNGTVLIRMAKVNRCGSLVFLTATVGKREWIINNGNEYLNGNNLPYYELYIPIVR